MSRTPPNGRTTSARRPRRARTRTTLSGVALAVLSPLALEYVVQSGDTVSEIAAEHGTTVARVVEANDLPAGGDEIYVGDVLRLPAAHRAGHEPAADAGSTAYDGRRRIEWHRVRPGDTMTEIAERYHAWTDELIAANGGSDYLQVGETVKVPVVVAAAEADSDDGGGTSAPSTRVARLRAELSEHADPSRARVRHVIVHTSRDYGVDPQLALAVSWQEAGWQQHHVSPDAAIGAMQVIPETGAWVEDVVGRDLDLMHVRDNVTAGVALLDQLTAVAHTRRAVAGYYQGLAAVRAHGMYDETRAYVANVLALKRSFERGDYPG